MDKKWRHVCLDELYVSGLCHGVHKQHRTKTLPCKEAINLYGYGLFETQLNLHDNPKWERKWRALHTSLPFSKIAI
jgi:hypothetical protein